jgi:hypothetical protein
MGSAAKAEDPIRRIEAAKTCMRMVILSCVYVEHDVLRFDRFTTRVEAIPICDLSGKRRRSVSHLAIRALCSGVPSERKKGSAHDARSLLAD